VLVAPDDDDVRSATHMARECFGHSLAYARRSAEKNRHGEVGGLEGGV